MKILFSILLFSILATITKQDEIKLRLLNLIPSIDGNIAYLTTDKGYKYKFILDLYTKLYLNIDLNDEITIQINTKTFKFSNFLGYMEENLEYFTIFLYNEQDLKANLMKDDRTIMHYADIARWSIINLSLNKGDLQLFTQNSVCYNCLYLPLTEVGLGYGSYISNIENATIHDFFLSIRMKNGNFRQEFTLDIQQYGIYTYIIEDSSDELFNIKRIIEREPTNTWIPLLVMAFILLGICFLRILFNYLYEKYQKKKISNSQINLINQSKEHLIEQKPALPSSRVQSLDTFRGMALVIMIFVNLGGGKYWFFNHSDWNGLTVADLVFPWFIWIMGTSMALSFDKIAKNKSKDFNHLDFIYKIIRRSVILFLLGMFLNNGYDLGDWRIPGVLQRFGVGYCVIALIASYIPKKDFKKWVILKDILDYMYQWIVVLVILLVYLLVTYLSELEGCPRGYTGAGGLADQGKYPHCTGGVAYYLDKKIFGYSHIYKEPTSQQFYKSGAFDPEGALGNLTSIFLTFSGYQAGRILIFYKDNKQKLIRWVIWGVLMCCISIGLFGGTKEDGLVPLNKNIWSVSFVLLLGGLAFLLIALCYWIVDMKKLWLGWPVIYVGRNSIAIYMIHELLGGYFPFSFLNNGSHSIVLFENSLGVAFCLWIAWRMNEEGVFIKV